MKIPPVRTELFHTDGRTDMKKLTVAFRKFSKARKRKQDCNWSKNKNAIMPLEFRLIVVRCFIKIFAVFQKLYLDGQMALQRSGPQNEKNNLK